MVFMAKPHKTEKEVCHDCGAKELELHKDGCDMEECRICGSQLITCHCYLRFFGIEDDKLETDWKYIYSNHLPEEMAIMWNRQLDSMTRIPYGEERRFDKDEE